MSLFTSVAALPPLGQTQKAFRLSGYSGRVALWLPFGKIMQNDVSVDTNNLYREDTYTDRKVGTIRVLTPVDVHGQPDLSRSTIFTGQVSVMTPMGTLPIGFEIDAPNLGEAWPKFGECAQKAVEDTMQEIQQMRREQASSLVIPDAAGNLGAQGSRIRMP